MYAPLYPIVYYGFGVTPGGGVSGTMVGGMIVPRGIRYGSATSYT